MPGLLDLKVRGNAVEIDGNMDAGLIAHFNTAQDLSVYLVHPAHLVAVEVVRANVNGRAAIDFED